MNTEITIGSIVRHAVTKETGIVWNILDEKYIQVDFGTGRFLNGKTLKSNCELINPPVIYFFTGIQYQLLKEQKQSLLIAIEQAFEEGIANDLTGILHLIDSLQETAVKIGIPETNVYPKKDEDEE
jgi:hypothetical protein